MTETAQQQALEESRWKGVVETTLGGIASGQVKFGETLEKMDTTLGENTTTLAVVTNTLNTHLQDDKERFRLIWRVLLGLGATGGSGALIAKAFGVI